MAENTPQTNPAGLVADPRLRRILLSLAYMRLGQQPASAEIEIRVEPGEGDVWYTPGSLPELGTIQSGTLVVASPDFPRFAPLTMTLVGADLAFAVRQGQLASLAFVDGEDTPLRLLCAGSACAGSCLRLQRADAVGQVVVSRATGLAKPPERMLPIHVTEGAIRSYHPLSPNGWTTQDKVYLRRNDQGELKIRLDGARLELDFREGALGALRIDSAHGPIARLRLLSRSGPSVVVTASFLDTLP